MYQFKSFAYPEVVYRIVSLEKPSLHNSLNRGENLDAGFYIFVFLNYVIIISSKECFKPKYLKNEFFCNKNIR